MRRLLKRDVVGSVLPAGERTRHHVSCNDSLGHRRVGRKRVSKICSGGGETAASHWLWKICCDWLKARLVTSKFSKIVLGGTAAPYTRRVWGAVIF
jgi:hypothetical protein